VRAEERMGLFRIDFDPVAGRVTSAAVPVGDGSAWVGSFSLSPDEQRIVYDTLGGGEEDLWVMNIDGSGRRRLTTDHANNRDPAWSADGRDIAFYSNREGKAINVWRIGPDGGGLRRLTDFAPPLGANGVSWTADGRLIVLAEPGPPGFVSLQGDLRRFDPVPGFEELKRTAFNEGLLRHDEELVTILDEGQRATGIYSFAAGRLESRRFLGASARWLPGRRQVVYHRDAKIWLHDRATQTDRMVMDCAPHDPWLLNLTEDGRRIYVSQAIRQGEIWLAQLGEGGAIGQ
jgi:dipeptidyl aminopeptidase/acylaminoacyl peptidase